MNLHSEVNGEAWIPSYFHQQEHIYILLTSLNLGGAEKIVSDQLWANHYSKSPKKVTLIVIYEKQKEHSLPPDVNVVRLNNNIKNGELLFRQIAYENKPLVCHLINDNIINYLFSLDLYIHLVIHNDKRGWVNSIEIFNHEQTISLIAVARHVKRQLREEGVKNTIHTFRHNIKTYKFSFNEGYRQQYRKELGFTDKDIVIGMTGRICQQKNYFLALDVIANLIQDNPNYKLVVLGGFEPIFRDLYIKLLSKINFLKLHKHVKLVGFKTDPEKWLNSFDVGLNTSYFEGLSMASQEFMRNGLPMVLSRVCGQPEISDIAKQLYFFDLPEILDTPETYRYHLHFDTTHESERVQEQFVVYQELIKNITYKIKKAVEVGRITYNDDEEKEISRLCYGSHNCWNLLNHIYPKYKSNEKTDDIRPAFITSNLNAGGAQRSLVNLLLYCKKQSLDIPLVLINQSNQLQYFNELIENKIDYYLCHSSKDVFDICSNLFTYFYKNNINKVVFWNVDSKMKLLISKFFSSSISIIDVSPGDYILSEMEGEKTFQEAIYYTPKEYFNNLSYFVSKYNNTRKEQEYKNWLKNDTVFIPNGVYFEDADLTEKKDLNVFKLLVCGRISPSKHLDTIFNVWRKFTNKYNDRSMVLDAYGSVEPIFMDYYHQLNQNFSDLFEKELVVWQGHHDNPKSIMKNYHAIAVLGTHQGSPNVVLESASCHLPTIANDSGGTREIINNETGYLLPEEINEEALFNALEELYLNYDNAWEKAQKCYHFTQENFSMDKMAQSYLELIYAK